MFGISGFELGLVALVALLVLGPERLPKAARFAGLWVRKARAQWFAVKSEMERELAAEELRASLQAERAAIRDAVKQLDDEARELQSSVRDATGDDAPPAADPPPGIAVDPKPPAP